MTLKQDFTRDQDRIDSAVQQFKTSANSGGARQIDAIDQAIGLLTHRGGPRRSCILLVGEARDRGSQRKLPGVLSQLQRSSITIYALTYSPYWTAFTTRAKDYTPPPMDESAGVRDSVSIPAILLELAHNAGKNTANAFALATGGRRLSFETRAGLETDLLHIGNDLHSRYLLSFTPDQNPPASFHKLEIRVRTHPDTEVNARPGYWSSVSR